MPSMCSREAVVLVATSLAGRLVVTVGCAPGLNKKLDQVEQRHKWTWIDLESWQLKTC